MSDIRNRGFASMQPEKQREIASRGGKAAHQKGTAHEFTPEEARLAGSKGGKASQAKRQKLNLVNKPPAPPKTPGLGETFSADATSGGEKVETSGRTSPIGEGVEIFSLLQEDHRNINRLLQRMLGEGRPSTDVQDELYPMLRREVEFHWGAETESLIPLIEQKSPERKSDVAQEDADIRGIISRLDSIYATEHGLRAQADDWFLALNELREQVERHVMQEEGEIFSELSDLPTATLNQATDQFRQSKQKLRISREHAA